MQVQSPHPKLSKLRIPSQWAYGLLCSYHSISFKSGLSHVITAAAISTACTESKCLSQVHLGAVTLSALYLIVVSCTLQRHCSEGTSAQCCDAGSHCSSLDWVSDGCWKSNATR